MIYKNGKNVTAIYKGSIPITKIYKGLKVVWEAFKTLVLNGIPPLTLKGSTGTPLIDYKIYGNSKKQTILPDEYQQVEYIEATGTQYFEIDYIANEKTNSKGAFQITNTAKANFLFGARVSSTAIGCYGLNWGGGQPYKYYNTYYGNSNDGMTSTNIDDKKHSFEKIGNKLYIDGTLIHTRKDTDGTIAFKTPTKMTIFACNTNGTIGLQTYSRLHNLSFNEGEGDLFNLISCYRKSDGVIGMYDIVNNYFHTNQGSGEFLKGADVPTPDNPLELNNVGDRTPNILNPDFELTKTGGYRFATLEGKTRTLTISVTDRDTSVDLSGISFGFTGTGNNSQGGYNWVVSNGRVQKTQTTNIVSNKGEPVETPYMFFSTYPNTEEVWNRVFSRFYIQIEDGETPTEYKPFGYEIPVEITNSGTYLIYANNPLAKIGDYVDYVDYKNQKVIRAVGIKTFDGSENWELHKTNTDNVVYRLDDVLTPLLNAPTSATYMTHFSLTDIYSTGSFLTGTYRFGFDQDKLTITSSRLYVSSDKTTVTEFKAWIAQNKPTIFYPLETPIEENIVLPEMQTIKGTNIIDVETEIKPSNVEITYKGK